MRHDRVMLLAVRPEGAWLNVFVGKDKDGIINLYDTILVRPDQSSFRRVRETLRKWNRRPSK